MSKVEKIVRLIIMFIAGLILSVCLGFIIEELHLEDKILNTFLTIGGCASIGLICGNSINNTLYLPEPEKKDEDKK